MNLLRLKFPEGSFSKTDRGELFRMNCPLCERNGYPPDTHKAFWAVLRYSRCGCFRCGYAGSLKAFLLEYDGTVLVGGQASQPMQSLKSLKERFKLRMNGSIPNIQIPNYCDLNDWSKADKYAQRVRQYLYDREWTDREIFTRGAGFALTKRLFNRVILPYKWLDGQIVYYQARAIKSDLEPKFINPTGKKDFVLYNLPLAVLHKEVALVEGIFDCVLDNCCGIGGKALTNPQINWVTKFWKQAIIFVDPDAKPFAFKMAQQLKEAGTSCRVGFSSGKDPGEAGPERTLLDLAKARDFSDIEVMKTRILT